MKGSTWIAAVALAAAASFVTPSIAQTTQKVGRMDTSLYLGAGIGSSLYQKSCDGVANCEDNNLGSRYFLGYQFHPNVAVEVGYVSHGKAQANDVVAGIASDASFKARGWEFVVLGLYPVHPQVSLFGKLGAVFAHTEATASGPIGRFTPGNNKETSTNLTFGLGAQWFPLQNWGGRAEWQRYQGVGGPTTLKDDIDFFSLSLMFRW
jgi:OOP family OmpA-OmpF porin